MVFDGCHTTHKKRAVATWKWRRREGGGGDEEELDGQKTSPQTPEVAPGAENSLIRGRCSLGFE